MLEILHVATPFTLTFTLSLFGMLVSSMVVWKAAVDMYWRFSTIGQRSEPPPETMRNPRDFVLPSAGST